MARREAGVLHGSLPGWRPPRGGAIRLGAVPYQNEETWWSGRTGRVMVAVVVGAVALYMLAQVEGSGSGIRPPPLKDTTSNGHTSSGTGGTPSPAAAVPPSPAPASTKAATHSRSTTLTTTPTPSPLPAQASPGVVGDEEGVVAALHLPALRAAGAPVQLWRRAVVDGTGVGECTPALDGSGALSQADASMYNALQGVDVAPTILEGGLPGVQVQYTLRLADGFPADSLISRAYMADASRARYCSARQWFRSDTNPVGGCPGDTGDTTAPANSHPWCYGPGEAIHVSVVDCALIENFIVHGDIEMNTMTNAAVLSVNDPRWHVEAGVPVTLVEEAACVGANVYPHTAGHFPNEILPNLLVLDRLLPPTIPLLWPSGGTAQHYLDELRSAGMLTPGRSIMQVPNGRSLYRVRRLHLLQPQRPYHASPNIAWLPQRIAGAIFNSAILARRVTAIGEEAAARVVSNRMLRVVFLTRNGGARSVTNHAEVVAKVQETLGSAFTIDQFTPGPADGNPMWVTADRVNAAGLYISPHGANMHNVMFLSNTSPTWVVEIGYTDPSFAQPTDWFCFARNLGHHYYVSVAVYGGYGSPLQADADDIGAIAAAYKEHVASLGIAV